MTFAILAGLGLLVGWGGGRLLVFPGKRGVPGDLLAGLLGSLLVGLVMSRLGEPDQLLVPLIGGVAGALVLTFIRRSFEDRYRRVAYPR